MGSIWEMMQGESAKAFAAFQIYRDLPATERSYAEVARIQGITSATQLERWGSPDKFNWVERARAYDAFRDRTSIIFEQAETHNAIQNALSMEGGEIGAMQVVLQRKIAQMLDAPNLFTTLDIARLTASLDKLHMMRRRNLGLPTNYTTEGAEEPVNEQPVFVAVPEIVEKTHGIPKEED